MGFLCRHRKLFLRTVGGGAVGGGLLFLGGIAYVVAGFDGSAALPAECAVVFGAAVHPKFDIQGKKVIASQAGPGIRRRVLTAVNLYREGKVRRLYFTGGRGDGMRQSEADVMGDLAIGEGVDPKDIVLETAATSTEENIRLTRPLTGSCGTVVGISDRYHLARIEYLARKQGWELSTQPAQGNATALFEAKSVIREVGAIFMFTVNDLLT